MYNLYMNAEKTVVAALSYLFKWQKNKTNAYTSFKRPVIVLWLSEYNNNKIGIESSHDPLGISFYCFWKI